MDNPVGLRLHEGGRIEYYDKQDLRLQDGDKVMINTEYGTGVAEVVHAIPYVPREYMPEKLEPVLSLATEEDLAYSEQLEAMAAEALEICREKVRQHGLSMAVERAIYTTTRSKLIFHFTAENRVDFRALVRDLASIFHTRIELLQIGVREDAKLSGGIGGCGRELCCATFLNGFEPVSIKMVKTQNLSLNPNKISGHCGRLMCCLNYEQDAYVEARKSLPRYGYTVTTPQGSGTVVDLDLLQERITVQIDGEGDEGRLVFAAQELGYGTRREEDSERAKPHSCTGCGKHGNTGSQTEAEAGEILVDVQGQERAAPRRRPSRYGTKDAGGGGNRASSQPHARASKTD